MKLPARIILFIISYIPLLICVVIQQIAGNSSYDASDMSGSYYTDSDRFRVQAMFPNPFDYGYICLMVLVLFEYFRGEKL